MGINILTITGRLGEKPMERHFPSGAKKTEVSFCHNRHEKDREGGEGVWIPDWYRLKAWGHLSEALSAASKGQEVTVAGPLALEVVRSDTKGHDVTIPTITVESFTLGRMPNGRGEAQE